MTVWLTPSVTSLDLTKQVNVFVVHATLAKQLNSIK